MKHEIPIAKPSLGEAEAAAARDVILSGWVTQGPQVAAFEEEFAKFVGANHACAVSNCTTALHLALHAMGVSTGDEVITVSHSFIATANAIRHCGATPVFIDIDPLTFNMDPQLIEPAITSRTKAILTVHQVGMPADMDKILKVAAKYNLPVVEDAACAIGSQTFSNGNWQMVGMPRGASACFSFHPRKVITAGEGGMITTNDSELDRQFRLLRQHGMSLSDTQRHSASQVVFEDYLQVGFNYRMTDIQAAIGRIQLDSLPHRLEKRREIAARYDAYLRQIPGLNSPHIPFDVRFNYQSYSVRVTDQFPVSRNELMQQLLDAGISTRRGIMNAHQEPAYENGSNHLLPKSESARDNVLLLPMYESMSHEEQEYVMTTLSQIGKVKCLSI